MRSLLLALLLVCTAAVAQVQQQQAQNNQGQSFLRLHNNSSYWTNCYYRDQFNYVTFNIAPYSTSLWYPVYGQYEWRCR